jgi:hypothetical protein
LTGARTLLTRFKSLVTKRTNPAHGGEKLKLAQEKLVEKNQRLRKLRQQIEDRDREITRLQPGLDGPGFAAESLGTFFVVGRAKSGTSWLRSILDTHPEVLCVNEGRFFGRDYKAEDKAIPRSLYGALADSKYLMTWVQRSPWSRGEDTDRHVRNLTRHVVDYFLTEKLAKTGKKFAGDKTPLISTEVIAEIAEIYPDAKVIHIVRDGRDVAVSSMHHIWNNATDVGGRNELRPEILTKRDAYRADPEAFRARGESIFVEGQLAATARNWAKLVVRAREDGTALLGDSYTEVRYEDILARPTEETGRLLRFLGAESSEETVERCVEKTSFERMAKRERGQEVSSSFFRKGVAGDWKGVFTEDDKRVFKKAAGELLIELGYEKDDGW